MQFLNANEIRKKYPIGTRLRLISMDDPYQHPCNGMEGTVRFVDDAGTIHMFWDNGSTLGLIPGTDRFEKI